MATSTAVTALKEKALKNRQQARPIEKLIQDSLQELGKAVPAHLSAERLVRIALTTLRLNPKLTECTPESFLGALFQSAQLGLEPNVEGQAYIIPYSNSKKVIGDNGKAQWIKVMEAQFQIGYKGYVELFYRHGSALSLDMHTVHENDIFEYSYGTEASLKHCPVLKNRGEVIAYYTVAKLKNGGTIFKIMAKDECMEHGRTHSKVFDKETQSFDRNSPWAKDPDAMCLKTVLIQLSKLLPKSIELQKALAMDNTTKSAIKLDMFEVKDETNWDDVPVIDIPKEDIKADVLPPSVAGA